MRTGNIANVTTDTGSLKTLYAGLVNAWTAEVFGAETAVAAFLGVSTAYMEKRHRNPLFILLKEVGQLSGFRFTYDVCTFSWV